MQTPLFIEPLFQKDSGDCAICCLVMLLGKTYPEIVKASPSEYLGKPYSCVKDGMTGKMMIETAAKFGATLKTVKKFDLQEDDGILTVRKLTAKSGSDSHAVLLINGKIMDPMDGRLWFDVEDFLRVNEYRTGTLLRLVE